MAKLIARGSPFPGIQSREEEEIVFDSADFSNGWCGDENVRAYSPSSLYYIYGFSYLGGKLIVNNGKADYSIEKPDSNKIMAITSFTDVTVGLVLLRFTRNKIYKIGSSGFLEITPDEISPLGGTDLDWYSFCSADNRFYFSNNGVDPIREVDAGTLTYKAVGNAPRYKYIISAFNRIIGANLRDTVDNPVEIGWSGDLNYTEWDPSVDRTSGYTSLVTSPSDTTDTITGLAVLENSIIIFRERSVWVGQYQASGTNPFYFYPLPGAIGCDCPMSIAKKDDGTLIWYNSVTGGVYQLNSSGAMDGDLTDIEGRRVKWAIRSTIFNAAISASPPYIGGVYNKNTKCYILYVSSPTVSVTYMFKYSFINKNWVADSINNVSTIYTPELPTSSITIAELEGTIDDLYGTIDQLGGVYSIQSTMFGFTNGEIQTQYPYTGHAGEEVTTTHLTNNSIIQSGIFSLPAEYLNWSKIEFNITPFFADPEDSQITVSAYIGDGDQSKWTLLRYKTVDLSTYPVNMPITITLRGPFRSKEIRFQILSHANVASLNRYTLKATRGGSVATGGVKV